jgi:hypothetical protein
MRALVAALGVLAALVLEPAALPAVEQGTIVVNRGAAGVKLGTTKAQVVALLGKPLFENAHGYMQYSKSNLFDVYLNPATKRVRLIGISGPKFCTVKGVCMMKKGGLAKIKAQYGAALRKSVAEDGEVSYEVAGVYNGKKVFTSFFPATTKPDSPIIQIFIGLK